jgi:hypothetical protein
MLDRIWQKRMQTYRRAGDQQEMNVRASAVCSSFWQRSTSDIAIFRQLAEGYLRSAPVSQFGQQDSARDKASERGEDKCERPAVDVAYRIQQPS